MIKQVYDRKKKVLVDEITYSEKTSEFLYHNFFGRLLTKYLIRQKWFNRLFTQKNFQEKSKSEIQPFITKYQINTEEFSKEINDFTSFNDFFIRDLKPGSRFIDQDKNTFIAPVDGRVLLYNISPGLKITAKTAQYSLQDLLQSDVDPAFENGYCFVFRLAVYDYHHFCYIDSGDHAAIKQIPGFLDTVNPNFSVPTTHTTNQRDVTVLNTHNFGQIIEVDIGALLVGKIKQNFAVGTNFAKGQEKGYFEFGGSTVVLLVKAGVILPDSDILEQSKQGVETLVKQGEGIARKI